MKELLYKALMNGLLREISVNEFLVLLAYICEKNDINTFEHTFNISYRTVQNLRPHLCQLGLFDKDGRQYKLNVDNTQAFLQQFVDSENLAYIVDDSENLASIVDDSENLASIVDDSEKLASIVDDSEKLASQNEPVGQNEPNDIPIELDGVEYKLSYMKNYFKELHSYPNGDDDWIKALDALKEACGGFTECLTHFEVNLGEHTIKTK